MFCALMSFIIGTVSGLNQVYIKRLLAFSTVSHVGFMILSLSLYSNLSMFSFIFYLTQYTITNTLAFLVLLGLGQHYSYWDIIYIREFKGLFHGDRKLYAISFAIAIFSMAGIPPLVGF